MSSTPTLLCQTVVKINTVEPGLRLQGVLTLDNNNFIVDSKIHLTCGLDLCYVLCYSQYTDRGRITDGS